MDDLTEFFGSLSEHEQVLVGSLATRWDVWEKSERDAVMKAAIAWCEEVNPGREGFIELVAMLTAAYGIGTERGKVRARKIEFVEGV